MNIATVHRVKKEHILRVNCMLLFNLTKTRTFWKQKQHFIMIKLCCEISTVNLFHKRYKCELIL